MDIFLKRGILERLKAGEIIIGDGGYTWALEKRGYVATGSWIQECIVEHPDAVIQLHKEFVRAGSDVIQTFTYRPSQHSLLGRKDVSEADINKAACNIAHKIANESKEDILICGGLCASYKYKPGCDKELVSKWFREHIEMFMENNVDFLLAEYFFECEEAEWCVEEMKNSGLPVAVSMCISTMGDHSGNSPQDCAVRLAKAGADIIGVNCRYDPNSSIKTIKLMKEGLEKAGISNVYLMIQPIGFMAPELDEALNGYLDLPDWPLAMESRTMTRFEVHKFAREAYDLGVRYIGGCCGFEAYHIRAIAEELAAERGRQSQGSKNHSLWGGDLKTHRLPWVSKRSTREYWENHPPSSGRPLSSSLSAIEGLENPGK